MPSKKEPLPSGIDRLPSGALRVRVYDADGKRRTTGTYRTLAAAIAARAEALGGRGDAGRTARSDAAWVRVTGARVRLVHPDDRRLLDVILDELERRAAARALASTEDA